MHEGTVEPRDARPVEPDGTLPGGPDQRHGTPHPPAGLDRVGLEFERDPRHRVRQQRLVVDLALAGAFEVSRHAGEPDQAVADPDRVAAVDPARQRRPLTGDARPAAPQVDAKDLRADRLEVTLAGVDRESSIATSHLGSLPTTANG